MRNQAFITLVFKMRDAQRTAKESRTRGNIEEAEALEEKVDAYILKNINEQVDFYKWIEQVRTDETRPPYNVAHETKGEEGGGA